ncbi:YhcH/YjgK/YiaL family protein [Bacillus sp. PS06]|uniref:YhcH/YjgK/YiaL family protein n=1 Tax=Bacillus sp. PS06 TaxID=2764176 RepID=UPI001784B4C9|nr:YhcH/YjgK/YiaL family protein [Bacillus sp. PS06]MBD8069427.1 YhcH/YjgK/YiaL family protein [Bacillus sp. PS06]
MIIDKLSNAQLYDGVHPRIQKGLQFLQENDLHALEPGKYEVEGDDVFVLIQEYETISEEQGRWESHRTYTDIQYMIRGQERMGYVNVHELLVAEEHLDKDLLFLEGKGDLLRVTEGSFAIFTPEDGHMPMISVQEPQVVKKAVVKVNCRK